MSLPELPQFMEVYLTNAELSKHTKRMYGSQIRHFLHWCHSCGITPATIVLDDIDSHIQSMIDSGAGAASVEFRMTVITLLYKVAHDNNFVQSRPRMDKLHTPKLQKRVYRKHLSIEDLAQMLNVPDQTSPLGLRNRAIIMLMGIYGLRVGEVTTLKLRDVNIARQRITFRGKANKVRTVYLTKKTTQVLCAWLIERNNIALSGVDAVFVSAGNRARGTVLSDRAIRFMVNKHLEELGLKAQGVSCHSLRHSAATWARVNGADLEPLSIMLGHTHEGSTQTYVHEPVPEIANDNPALYIEHLIR